MDWKTFNESETAKPYYKRLYDFVTGEYTENQCYPPYSSILNALAMTPLDQVRCVILGQDPYHNPGEAMGLSFSVPKGVAIPPSLQNIYKEIHDELGLPIPAHGDLTKWARQGVLLLNSVLTVRAHQPASHAGKGWETYTDAILSEVNAKSDPVVFMLWGNFAKSKRYLLDSPKHLVLESPHPSPFSANRGFFGNMHFVECNRFLSSHGRGAIDWSVD